MKKRKGFLVWIQYKEEKKKKKERMEKEEEKREKFSNKEVEHTKNFLSIGEKTSWLFLFLFKPPLLYYSYFKFFFLFHKAQRKQVTRRSPVTI